MVDHYYGDDHYVNGAQFTLTILQAIYKDFYKEGGTKR